MNEENLTLPNEVDIVEQIAKKLSENPPKDFRKESFYQNSVQIIKDDGAVFHFTSVLFVRRYDDWTIIVLEHYDPFVVYDDDLVGISFFKRNYDKIKGV